MELDLNSENSNKNLGKKARKGLSWSLFGNLIKQILNVAVSIVIARILGPEEYGIVALAAVFIAFSEIFVDVGFTDGIIQKKEVSKVAISSVFYFNILTSIILAIGIYFLAPAIGSYFEVSEVVGVIQLLLVVLPISALGKIHSALLSKNLNIKALTIRDISSSIFGGAVGLVLAFNDYGVWSLVWQQITMAFTGTVFLWVGTNFIPLFVFSWSETKKLAVFSYYIFIDSLMQQVLNKIDSLFVGKMFSPVVLGLYNRSSSLAMLINDFSTKSLVKVVFPVFSALQNDRQKIIEVFTKFMCLTIVATTFLVGIMFFSSELIIIGLLGEEWRPSVYLFQILAFSTISLPLRAIVFKAILGLGFSKMKFRLSLINNIFKLASIPFGYFYGIEAFAWSVVIGRFFDVAVSWMAFNKLMKINLFVLLSPIFLPISILLFWCILFYFNPFIANMIIYLPLFLISYLLILNQTDNYGFVLLKSEIAKVKSSVSRRIKKDFEEQ